MIDGVLFLLFFVFIYYFILARLITMLIDLCFFFFFLRLGWIGPRIRPRNGWMGPTETWRARFGAKKKTNLLNGLSPSNRGRLPGRVWVSKNLARTWPVPVPIYYYNYESISLIKIYESISKKVGKRATSTLARTQFEPPRVVILRICKGKEDTN